MEGRFRITFQPVNRALRVKSGMTVRDAAAQADIFLDSPCGGKGKCGKCRVHFSEGIPEPTDSEKALLSSGEIEKGMRLACCAPVLQDSVVTILPGADGVLPQILAFGDEKCRGLQFDPPLRAITLEDLNRRLSESTSSDIEVVLEMAGMDGSGAGLPVGFLRALPEALRACAPSRTALVMSDGRFLGLTNETNDLYGVAVDVGTTTIVGTLIDLTTGEQLSIASRLNAQAAHGADTISRINFCSAEVDGLRDLNASVIRTVNEIVDELSEESGISPDAIWEMTVVGNTTMMHLFVGVSPKYLGLMPYAPVFRRPPKIAAAQLRLKINPHANVHVLPCIGSFVGADSVGVILSRGMQFSNSVKLAVDIGTNGEILVGSSKRLIASSTAAGPALEGAEVSCGMRGMAGAIERVELEDGDLTFNVIGGGKPIGVCGSGLVDLVALLVQHGVVHASGRLLAPEELPKAARDSLGNRLVRKPEGNEFVLYRDADRELRLTQRDIRKIQLAKGAIRAGIEILKSELGVEDEDIDQVFIAGAFGNYIRKSSAVTIGLLPPFPLEKIRPIGNAASAGAKLALVSRQARREAAEIASKTEHIELGGKPTFQNAFAEAMMFPG